MGSHGSIDHVYIFEIAPETDTEKEQEIALCVLQRLARVVRSIQTPAIRSSTGRQMQEIAAASAPGGYDRCWRAGAISNDRG